MPLDLSGVASTNNLSDNQHSGNWSSGYITPDNADIVVTIQYGVKGILQDSVGPKKVTVGQSLNFTAPAGGSITEISFASAMSGTPASVFGYFGEDAAVGIIASQSGQAGPNLSTINGLTGRVDAAGNVVLGTGWTGSKLGTGNVNIIFTTALAVAPIVVLTAISVTTPVFVWQMGLSTANGFNYQISDAAGNPIDAELDFIAIVPQ